MLLQCYFSFAPSKYLTCDTFSKSFIESTHSITPFASFFFLIHAKFQNVIDPWIKLLFRDEASE